MWYNMVEVIIVLKEYNRMIEQRLLHTGFCEMRYNGEIVYVDRHNCNVWTVYSPYIELCSSPKWPAFDEGGHFWRIERNVIFVDDTKTYIVDALVDEVDDHIYKLTVESYKEYDKRPIKNNNVAPPWQKRPRPTRLGVG